MREPSARTLSNFLFRDVFVAIQRLDIVVADHFWSLFFFFFLGGAPFRERERARDVAKRTSMHRERDFCGDALKEEGKKWVSVSPPFFKAKSCVLSRTRRSLLPLHRFVQKIVDLLAPNEM